MTGRLGPSSLDLTSEEQQHVRAALQFLRRRTGGWEPLAKVLHTSDESLRHIAAGRNVTPTLAFRVARFSKVTLDDVITGVFPGPGTCPYCGHRKEEPDDSGVGGAE